MPAKSEAQRRLFGMVVAYKEGNLPDASEKVKQIAKGVSLKDAKDFAKSIKQQDEIEDTFEEEKKKLLRDIQGIKQNIARTLKDVLIQEKQIDDMQFQKHVLKNRSKIKRLMQQYGFKMKDLKHIGNYYDFASITDLDTRRVKDIDLEYYSAVLYDLLTQH